MLPNFIPPNTKMNHIMKHLESLPKKTPCKSDKLTVVPLEYSNLKPQYLSKRLTTKNKVCNLNYLLKPKTAMEKKAMNFSVAVKMPEMCPEFGL